MADWSILLLAAALSIDAWNIGMICGFEGIRIPLGSRLLMALVTTASTAAAVGIGFWLSGILPPVVGQIIGTVMLSGLGLYMTIGAVKKLLSGQGGSDKSRRSADKGLLRETAEVISCPVQCDADGSQRIEKREAAAIGFALSGDSVACGLSAGIGAGLSMLLIPLLCGVFQMLFLWCGGWAAGRLRHIGHFRHEWLSIGAGLLLIAMAIGRCFC